MDTFTDITMWGGNATTLDILVKPNSLTKVNKMFSDSNIKYNIVIQDLQQAIDEENPSVIELDDRRGNLFDYSSIV